MKKTLSSFPIVPHPRNIRGRSNVLLLDPVYVHHVAAHGVFSREDGATNRADCVAPVYTAMVG